MCLDNGALRAPGHNGALRAPGHNCALRVPGYRNILITPRTTPTRLTFVVTIGS